MFHSRTANEILLQTGSNIGDRFAYLIYAIQSLQKLGINIHQKSHIYESEAWGFSAETFLNQIIAATTSLTPNELLQLIKKIELKSGRISSNPLHYSDRTLDIDILYFNDQIVDQPNLKIPHPKIQDRRFVLLPLHEIMPHLKHPKLQQTTESLLTQCTDKGKVEIWSKVNQK